MRITMNLSRERLALLGLLSLVAALAVIGEAQPRPATLTAAVWRGAPGTTFRIDVDPVIGLNAESAAETRVVLRPPRAQGPQTDVVLRMVEYHGGWFLVRIPDNADPDLGQCRLLWLNRRGDILATSGDRLFRLGPATAEAAQQAGGGVDPRPKQGPVTPKQTMTTPGVRGEAGQMTVPQSAPGGISAQAKRLPTPVVDYVTIGLNELDIKHNVRYPIAFMLPSDVRNDDRAVLTFLVNAQAGGVNNELYIRINGQEVESIQFNTTGTRAWTFTFDARILRSGRNEIVFSGMTGGLRLKVKEIVLWFHRDIAW